MNRTLSVSLGCCLYFCTVSAFAQGYNPYVVPNPTPAPGTVSPVPYFLPLGPPPVAVEPVPAPPVSPAPLGWVYGPYCAPVGPSSCVVSLPAHGLNVRDAPNGYGAPFMAITNGTPLIVLGAHGRWLHVAVACNLAPTGLWSWTAGVPLAFCI